MNDLDHTNDGTLFSWTNFVCVAAIVLAIILALSADKTDAEPAPSQGADAATLNVPPTTTHFSRCFRIATRQHESPPECDGYEQELLDAVSDTDAAIFNACANRDEDPSTTLPVECIALIEGLCLSPDQLCADESDLILDLSPLRDTLCEDFLQEVSWCNDD